MAKQTEEERKRSDAAKKAAETRRKNQEEEAAAKAKTEGPQKDSRPSGPVSAGPDSAELPPVDRDSK